MLNRIPVQHSSGPEDGEKGALSVCPNRDRPESENAEIKTTRTLGSWADQANCARAYLKYYGVASFEAAYYYSMYYRSGPSDLACVHLNYLHG